MITCGLKAKHVLVGHPQAEMINQVQKLVMEDSCVTTQELPDKVGISLLLSNNRQK